MNELAPPRRSGPHAALPGAAPPLATEPGIAPDLSDPRARAAARAAQLRGHGSLDDGDDKFFIPAHIIPDGWSYEYKRHTVYGAPDPSYEVSLAQKGWEPVPASRHPELMPPAYQGNTIIRDGLVLMERPAEITDERRRRDQMNARDQVRAKEEQLGAAPIGHFDRDNKGTPLAKIKKSVEVGIPDK